MIVSVSRVLLTILLFSFPVPLVQIVVVTCVQISSSFLVQDCLLGHGVDGGSSQFHGRGLGILSVVPVLWYGADGAPVIFFERSFIYLSWEVSIATSC